MLIGYDKFCLAAKTAREEHYGFFPPSWDGEEDKLKFVPALKPVKLSHFTGRH